MPDTSNTPGQNTPAAPPAGSGSSQPPSPAAQAQPIRQAQQAAQAQQAQPQGQSSGSSGFHPDTTPPYVLTQSGDFFVNREFDRKVASFQRCSSLITGYKTLDRLQPFYPGLYVLGAISSLGKTTFAGQLADQVAASGRWVIYVSLEQTPFEITSKSLARGFRRTNIDLAVQQHKPVDSFFAPSSIDIRRGMAHGYPAELDQQIQHYVQHVGNRLCIVHGAFSLTVEDIIDVVNAIITQLRKLPSASPDETPVLIVDYLQIVAPTMINGRIPDSKTSIDHVVHMLKAMQSELDMTVLVISSLNRQNYLNPIDFESFKESGGIEYTADVMWGLQLGVMNQPGFHVKIGSDGKPHGPTSMAEKREMISQAKRASPRKIDLICMKNRYGIASYSLGFDYFPRHDYFRPAFAPNDPDAFSHDIIPPCIYQQAPGTP